MNTFSQGKDTFFINTINLSSSLMDEVKIGLELEKRKEEAEQAILNRNGLINVIIVIYSDYRQTVPT